MASDENPTTTEHGRSCPVSTIAAARLDALMTALAAEPGEWDSAASVIATGTDAALELANRNGLLGGDPAPGWNACLYDLEAIGGRHLLVASPDGREFEVVFDAEGKPFSGSMWAGTDDAFVVVPIAFSNDPTGSCLRPLEETIEQPGSSSSQTGRRFATPVFADPFGRLGRAAVATVVHEAFGGGGRPAETSTRSQEPVAPTEPRIVSTAPTSLGTAAGFCEECGEPRRATARFCRRCGSALPPLSDGTVDPTERRSFAKPPRGSPAGGLCPACGGTIEPTWRFCKHCGSPTPSGVAR